MCAAVLSNPLVIQRIVANCANKAMTMTGKIPFQRIVFFDAAAVALALHGVV